MKLHDILNEMEIKREFKEVARFKSGEFTYLVKMTESDVVVESEDGKRTTIKAIAPQIAISFLSSQKRDAPIDRKEREGDKNIIRRKVRDGISKSFNNMYSMLTPEEVEKYGAQDAMPKLIDTFKSYFSKYNPDYILSNAYKDNRSKRERFYGTMLKRLGYQEIAMDKETRWVLYGKKKGDIKEILNVGNFKEKLGKNLDNLPRAIGTIKALASNL